MGEPRPVEATLDEAALRLPTFRDGFRVRMADGLAERRGDDDNP